MASLSKSAQRSVRARDRTCRAAEHLPDECSERHDIHHILPRSMGGRNRQKNLLYVCRHHHDLIHDHRHQAVAVAAGLLRLAPLIVHAPKPDKQRSEVMSGAYAPQSPPKLVKPTPQYDEIEWRSPDGRVFVIGAVYPPYARR